MWYIGACFYSYHSYFSFLTLGFLVFFIFFLFHCCSLSFSVFCCSLLCTCMAFYTICHDKIYRFYPLTTFGLLWVSFQDYPLVCRLPNQHYYTVLVMSCLILDKSGYVLFFTSLGTPIRIRAKLLSY